MNQAVPILTHPRNVGFGCQGMCEGLKPQGHFLMHKKSPQEGRTGKHLDLTAKQSLKKSSSCALAVHKIFVI